MKKIIFAIVFCLMLNSSVVAKDYAKIHMQEMKKAQKYNTTDKYYADFKNDNAVQIINVKDPKLIHLSGYRHVSADKLKAKEAADNLKYSKIQTAMSKKKSDDFNIQAYGEDFYNIYRVAEKIIRANNLDYINWRIIFSKDKSFNAASVETNCIVINAGAYDTLSTNEDALAILIGHEIAHSVLGHQVRIAKYLDSMNKWDPNCMHYVILTKRYQSASKKMEYAADTEGAKLALRAGYDLSKAKETLSYLYTMDIGREYYYTHPTAQHRLENYAEVQKYFMEDELKKQGTYNLYNSDVLNPRLSSDRKSLIIERNSAKPQSEAYKTETPVDFYTRYAYKSYLNGEFDKAENYFDKLIDLDKNNYVVYLYFSYNEECLYNKTGKKQYLENAKFFANKALELAPSDKNVKKQVDSL